MERTWRVLALEYVRVSFVCIYVYLVVVVVVVFNQKGKVMVWEQDVMNEIYPRCAVYIWYFDYISHVHGVFRCNECRLPMMTSLWRA